MTGWKDKLQSFKQKHSTSNTPSQDRRTTVTFSSEERRPTKASQDKKPTLSSHDKRAKLPPEEKRPTVPPTRSDNATKRRSILRRPSRLIFEEEEDRSEDQEDEEDEEEHSEGILTELILCLVLFTVVISLYWKRQ